MAVQLNHKLFFMRRTINFPYFKFNAIFWILLTKRPVCVVSFEYLNRLMILGWKIGFVGG